MRALLLALALTSGAGGAASLEVPVTLPYVLIQRQLAERIFTGHEQSLEALRDTSGCNVLQLARPRVDAHPRGGLRVRLAVEARGGTPGPGATCLLPFTWRGTVELREEAYIGNTVTAIAFRVADSDLLAADGARSSVPGVLWDWVKQAVQPRLESFTVELEPMLGSSRDLVVQALASAPTFAEAAAGTLRLARAEGRPEGLVATLALDLPEVAPTALPPLPHAPLDAAEMLAWDRQWQAWDAFATWLVKALAADASPALRAALRDVLVEARYELRDAVSAEQLAADPVRVLFVRAWTRLAPLVAESAQALPGEDALRYLAFINAGDALSALDQAGANFGVTIDSRTLRQLARLLLPSVDDAVLEYDEGVDPELRALLGLPPDLPRDGGPLPSAARWLDWFLASAQAAAPNRIERRELVKLNAWVPRAGELDAYIDALDALLETVAHDEQQRGKVATAHREIHRLLLRATAWQETCWRQYVAEGGRLEPLRSSAGSIGLMQINQHVWRGIYDLRKLASDIDYNARAGNEILVHYLVDFAVAKREDKATGDPHSLARATYAVYNGGPAHLRRYREAKTPKALRAIDQAFWEKYQAMRTQGAAAVKSCYVQE